MIQLTLNYHVVYEYSNVWAEKPSDYEWIQIAISKKLVEQTFSGLAWSYQGRFWYEQSTGKMYRMGSCI